MIDKYANNAVFIGLITTPINRDSRDFFANEFYNNEGGLFRNYKLEKINSFDKKEKQIKEAKKLEYLFEPKAFNIFGHMDIAIISLVDDFIFGSHVFHPNHSYKRTIDVDLDFIYDFKTISGYTPNFSLNRTNLEKKWHSILNKKKEKYPLIGITKIKLNSSLMIGSGKKFLNPIAKFIEITAENIHKKELALDFILVETFCSFEYTLLSFSNSYETITDFIINIRESDVSNLTNQINKYYETKPEQKSEQNKLNSIINLTVKECILNDWAHDFGDSDIIPSEVINNSHIVTTTLTTFGYDIDYFSDFKNFMKLPPNSTNKFKFLLNFDVKPGHLNTFLTQLEKTLKNEHPTISIPTGSGFLSLELDEFHLEEQKLPNPFLLLNKANSYNLDTKKGDFIFYPNFRINENVNKFITTLHQNRSFKDLKNSNTHSKPHLQITKILKEWTFTKVNFDYLYALLSINKISNVHRDRIIKMFHNYNKEVVSPIHFSLFIELRAYLIEVIRVLEDLKAKQISLEDKHIMLSEFVSSFEHAYKNRIHQTSLVDDNVTDSNLEYSGGIHQIISGYNAAFNVIISGVYGTRSCSIVYVSGIEGIDTNIYELRINYYHIYVVQSFLSLLVKESANFFINWKNHITDTVEDIELKNLLSYVEHNQISYDNLRHLRHKYISHIKENGVNDKNFSGFIHLILNEDLFSSLFADQVTFVFGFSEDKDLLNYWYWSNFLQIPNHYDTTGGINNEYFVVLLFRLLILFHNEEGIEYAQSLRNKIPTDFMKSNWNEYFDKVLECVTWFVSQKEYSDWKKATVQIRSTLFQNMFMRMCTKDEHELLYTAITENSIVNTKKVQEITQNVRQRTFSDIKGDANKFIKYYKQGKTIEYQPTKNNSPQKHVLKLIYSYLKCIKDFNNHEIHLLDQDQRRNKTMNNFTQTGDYSNGKIMVDSFGGTYTHDYSTTTNIFKIRCSIINSIIDFSLKQKKDYFIK